MKRKSQAVKNAIIQGLANGNKIMAVCKGAGIHFDTYRDWTDESSPRYDSLFSINVKKALDSGVKIIEEICVDVILKAATDKDRPTWTAAAWMLERCMPDKYSTRANIDHTTKGESIHKKIDLSKLSDEEIEIMATIQKKLME